MRLWTRIVNLLRSAHHKFAITWQALYALKCRRGCVGITLDSRKNTAGASQTLCTLRSKSYWFSKLAMVFLPLAGRHSWCLKARDGIPVVTTLTSGSCIETPPICVRSPRTFEPSWLLVGNRSLPLHTGFFHRQSRSLTRDSTTNIHKPSICTR